MSGDDVVITMASLSLDEPSNAYTSFTSIRGLSSTSGVSWWSDPRATVTAVDAIGIYALSTARGTNDVYAESWGVGAGADDVVVTGVALRHIALRHARSAQAKRVTDVYLVIGQLSSIVDDSVQFYWEIISKGTLAEGSRLHFERILTRLNCLDCNHQYSPSEADFSCPACESIRVKVIAGDYQPDAGAITIGGETFDSLDPITASGRRAKKEATPRGGPNSSSALSLNSTT